MHGKERKATKTLDSCRLLTGAGQLGCMAVVAVAFVAANGLYQVSPSVSETIQPRQWCGAGQVGLDGAPHCSVAPSP